MISESISSGILNPNSIIEIEITDKQIIGVLPNKTIIKDLSEFTVEVRTLVTLVMR